MQEFKVRITKCSVPSAWYEDMVGQTIDVTSKGKASTTYQCDIGRVYNIPKDDCEVVQDAA